VAPVDSPPPPPPPAGRLVDVGPRQADGVHGGRLRERAEEIPRLDQEGEIAGEALPSRVQAGGPGLFRGPGVLRAPGLRAGRAAGDGRDVPDKGGLGRAGGRARSGGARSGTPRPGVVVGRRGHLRRVRDPDAPGRGAPAVVEAGLQPARHGAAQVVEQQIYVVDQFPRAARREARGDAHGAAAAHPTSPSGCRRGRADPVPFPQPRMYLRSGR
jgi:hypothetical protein